MARGKVMWHMTMSLDGFIAGPNHSMDWLSSGVSATPGVVDAAIESTGAILMGRRGFDSAADLPAEELARQPYGGRWHGPIFMLTHHPEDARPAPGITVLSCDLKEAVATALDAANGKNLQLFSADIARQCVAEGLVDEFYVHVAPVMVGDGIRLFDSPGTAPVRWHRIHDGDPTRAVDLRYRPA